MKFHLYKDDNGEHRWRIKSRNGKIVADSAEGYKRKVDCVKAIQAIVKACVMADEESELIVDGLDRF